MRLLHVTLGDAQTIRWCCDDEPECRHEDVNHSGRWQDRGREDSAHAEKCRECESVENRRERPDPQAGRKKPNDADDDERVQRVLTR